MPQEQSHEDVGVVARLSEGWSDYHRMDCDHAPRRGEPGTRHTIRGPWGYLAARWVPCDHCEPPRHHSGK